GGGARGEACPARGGPGAPRRQSRWGDGPPAWRRRVPLRPAAPRAARAAESSAVPRCQPTRSPAGKGEELLLARRRGDDGAVGRMRPTALARRRIMAPLLASRVDSPHAE